MGISLVFAGRDVDYTKRLSLFFLENYKLDYEVFFFSEQADLLGMDLEMDSGFGENIFYVLEESFFDGLPDEFRDKNKDNSVILTGAITSKDTGNFLCIFKYQNVFNICDKIVDFIDEHSHGELVNKISARAKLYIFYSPVSYSGNSLLSECFALLKSGLDRRVLYISLDSFTKVRFRGASKFTSSDFFSAIKSGDGILASLKKMRASHGELDYLLPFNYELDKSCLDLAGFVHIISYIVEQGEYDYVCLDLSKEYFAYAYGLADICERLVITVGNQEDSGDKYLKFKDELARIYKGVYDEKSISILNKLTRSRQVIDCDYTIGYDEKVSGAKVLDETVMGSIFVRDIRGILGG